MPELIDSHCHLDDERLLPTENDVIARAREVGVTRMVTIGTDENTSAAAAALAARHPGSSGTRWARIPTKPTESAPRNGPRSSDWPGKPIRWRSGEIGLDYHHESSREKQFALFEKSLNLARSLNLPVVIHDRDAHGTYCGCCPRKPPG